MSLSRGLVDGGAGVTSRLCFASSIILYRISDIKTTKISSLLRWIMQQSFVTTAPAPPLHTHIHIHKRGIAGTMTIHPSQPWDLLRVIELLFIIINSTGYMCIILLARHLPGTAGELKRLISRTLGPLSPAHSRRCVWGGGAVIGYR